MYELLLGVRLIMISLLCLSYDRVLVEFVVGGVAVGLSPLTSHLKELSFPSPGHISCKDNCI